MAVTVEQFLTRNNLNTVTPVCDQLEQRVDDRILAAGKPEGSFLIPCSNLQSFPTSVPDDYLSALAAELTSRYGQAGWRSYITVSLIRDAQLQVTYLLTALPERL